MSPDSPITENCHRENATLLSLFDNAVLRRQSDQDSYSSSDDVTHSTPGTTHLENVASIGKVRSKRTQVRQTLLSLLPSPADLEAILKTTDAWWSNCCCLFPELSAAADQKTLQQFVSWGFEHDNPVIVAFALLCLAMSLQEIPHEGIGFSLNLPLSPQDLMNHYLTVVERFIISDSEYARSHEGIEVIAFQAKTYVNLGQPRKGWILFRRAITFAQLMGLHRNRLTFANDSNNRRQRRQGAWWFLCEIDRYMSLLLDLPYAVADGQNDLDTEIATGNGIMPAVVYRRKLSAIAGRVIDRNQASSPPSLSLTLDLVEKLDDLAKAMPDDWWNITSAGATGRTGSNEFYECLMAQFWHHQIKAFLHLPFMLQSASDCRFEYSRLACLDASRDLIQTYHIMRLNDGAAFYMCKVIDFVGFTAAVLLLLSLLGYGRINVAHKAQPEEKDLHLIYVTMDILRRASSENGSTVAAQALQVLETLSAALNENGSRDGGSRPKWNRKLIVPYFGTITISSGSSFSTSKTPSSQSPAGTVAPPPASLQAAQPLAAGQGDEAMENNLFGFCGVQTPSFHGPDQSADFELPHIDIDWQSMMNVDLDQDWNWFLNGEEI
ncbi:MAG: hypothetical protein M1830_002658 [Pleopsidium flavum]|nr:MAG: hypothetical protein M1830_002658 [Pleopsidium flavum]